MHFPVDLYEPIAEAAHPDDLGTLALVSKDFLVAARKYQVWHLDGPDGLHRFGALVQAHGSTFVQHVRVLVYSQKTPYPVQYQANKFIEVIRQCFHVRRLNIAVLPFEAQSQEQLFAILPHLPALRHLLLGNSNVLEPSETAVHFDLLPDLLTHLPLHESLALGTGPAPSDQQGFSMGGSTVQSGFVLTNVKGTHLAPLPNLQTPRLELALTWFNASMLANVAQAAFPTAKHLGLEVLGAPLSRTTTLSERWDVARQGRFGRSCCPTRIP